MTYVVVHRLFHNDLERYSWASLKVFFSALNMRGKGIVEVVQVVEDLEQTQVNES
jgi:hypothetical protein